MSEWFAMGGYGAYVWSAYAVALIVLVWDVIAPLRTRRQLRRRKPVRGNRPPPATSAS